MASRFKTDVVKNLYKSVYNKYCFDQFDQFYGVGRFNLNSEKSKVSLNYKWKNTRKADSNFCTYMQKVQEEFFDQKIISGVHCEKSDKEFSINVDLECNNLIKDVLDSNPINLTFKPTPKKVIVEYSSPNIAKPFHMGHLRSTVIGNFLANLKSKLGNNVTRLNYLGDWGTQFGLLQVGVELQNLDIEELKKDPITLLYKAYVLGNREAEVNDEIFKKAKKIFQDLENGDEQMLNKWNQYRIWTMEELKSTYNRLGIVFDEYSWESNYKREYADEILDILEKKGILSDEKGSKIAVIEDKKVPLVKVDNTTLYLLRDLMAVYDRRSKYKFDEMYYVVESGQGGHFNSLFSLCEKLEINKGVEMKHVKFGKIQGLSTRKGKMIFLKDILNEAKERAFERQIKSSNTKVPLTNKDVADVIGISSVIVNDLKRHRQINYNMSWEDALHLQGHTGSMLQYCHCRLCSLEANSGVKPSSECDPAALQEPEAINVVLEIANFEQYLLRSNRELEPCIFVNYLFNLTKTINLAFKALNVRSSDPHVGSQRLLLFIKAREVLKDGLKILGLKPLTVM